VARLAAVGQDAPGLVGWVSVGAALVVGGVILGASLTGSGTPLPMPPAPQTVCGTQDAASHLACMNQSQGDPSAAFVVEGRGFPPRTALLVKLSEIGPPAQNKPLLSITSTFQPVTSADGTFKVLVSELYPGRLPLGLVTVQVTAPGRTQAQTEFMVVPPGALPPGGGPPSGS